MDCKICISINLLVLTLAYIVYIWMPIICNVICYASADEAGRKTELLAQLFPSANKVSEESTWSLGHPLHFYTVC